MIPEVSIIIVSYNRPDVLHDTLKSVKEHIVEPLCEIIVVDNASSDKNVEMLRRDFPDIRLIECTANEGFGAGCNRGARQSAGKYLLFVNSDVLLTGNPVPGMIGLFRADPRIGVVGCQMRNRDGSLQPSFFRFPGLGLRLLQLTGLKKIIIALYPRIRYRTVSGFSSDVVSGAFFMIAADLFAKIGGFDERFFMYVEDADICFQAHRAGRSVAVYNTPLITHLGEHYEDVNNLFLLFHYNRSLILFYRKNYHAVELCGLSLMTAAWITIDLMLGRVRGRDRRIQERLRMIRRMYCAPWHDIDASSVSGLQTSARSTGDL